MPLNRTFRPKSKLNHFYMKWKKYFFQGWKEPVFMHPMHHKKQKADTANFASAF